jgi:hypothetical protein
MSEPETDNQKALADFWEKLSSDTQIKFESEAQYMYDRGYYHGDTTTLAGLAKIMAWKDYQQKKEALKKA